jgi:hypothetical protein
VPHAEPTLGVDRRVERLRIEVEHVARYSAGGTPRQALRVSRSAPVGVRAARALVQPQASLGHVGYVTFKGAGGISAIWGVDRAAFSAAVPCRALNRREFRCP